MALSKKIKLDNGIEVNYYVVNIIETINSNSVKVQLDGFGHKNFYNKAIEKIIKLKEQKDLIQQFNEIASKEKLLKTDQTKLDKLQTKINNLADKIDNLIDYENYILTKEIIILNNIYDFSKENIEKELLNTELFKGAEIVD